MPTDVFAVICCFMQIDVLVSVRQTCQTLHAGLVNMWHNALFVPSGKWYQLKNVALTAKYMKWTARVPSPPPILSTMDDIAFWGTLVDGDRLIATLDPRVFTIQTYIHNYQPDTYDVEPEDLSVPGRLVWSTRTDVYWCRPTEYTRHSKATLTEQCQINMYAVISLSSGDKSMYEVTSGYIDPNQIWYDEHSESFEFNPAELEFGFLSLYVGRAQFFFGIPDKTLPDFTLEWFDEYLRACPTKRLEMETAFVHSAANAGRGWNSTRQDILEQFTAQLH